MFGTEEGIIAIAYMLALVLPALLGTVAGLPGGDRSPTFQIVLCAISCVAGVLALPLVLCGADLSAELPVGSLIGDYAVRVDLASAFFVTVSSTVFLMVLVHMSHSGHGYSSRYMALACALFLSSTLCMIADTALLLLIAWETVSLVTFLMADNGEDDVPRWRFFAVTHIGGIILMAVFGYLWAVSGSGYLHDWSGLGSAIGGTASSIAVFLLFIGFGTKLGTVPFHAWIPDMYASSPTHTTALLTTVCSNVAVLVLFKGVFSYICVGPGDLACAAVVCLLAACTAMWGAMESMIQSEPKRILAYSSMENMALVVLCMGIAIVFSGDLPALEALALLAALLHTLNHSVFKSLMMLTVDTVEDATGERKIDRMGGLACVFPALSVVALVGIASLAAIPPMNGFVSEWLMLQSLIGSDAVTSGMRLVLPLAVAMLGVCGMIVATSYARLYSFVFLGRPRSDGAAAPRPIRKGSIAPMAVLAAMCVGMGLFAMPIMDSLSAGMRDLVGIQGVSYADALSGEIRPLTIGLMLLGTMAVLIAASRMLGHSKTVTETWGCGGTLDERMQYSSEGFSQPIVKVFHPFYGDTSEVRGGRYSTKFVEPFVKYIYRPVGTAMVAISDRVSGLQTGNIQSYLAYILVTLIVSLLAVRLL